MNSCRRLFTVQLQNIAKAFLDAFDQRGSRFRQGKLPRLQIGPGGRGEKSGRSQRRDLLLHALAANADLPRHIRHRHRALIADCPKQNPIGDRDLGVRRCHDLLKPACNPVNGRHEIGKFRNPALDLDSPRPRHSYAFLTPLYAPSRFCNLRPCLCRTDLSTKLTTCRDRNRTSLSGLGCGGH